MWHNISLSQCIANAGSDTTLCVGMWGIDPTILGGSPAASGGTAPYTYTWEATIDIGFGILHASDFLDDTTVANPLLISSHTAPITFYLTVTDEPGNSCADTVTIDFSVFTISTAYYEYWMVLGDSVPMFWDSPVTGNHPPLSYDWNPGQYLSDSTILTPWASPLADESYYLTITDSVGCSINAGPFYIVHVEHVGLEQQEKGNLKGIFPNPVFSTSTLICEAGPTDKKVLLIFSSKGELVNEIEFFGQEVVISKSDLGCGTFYYKVVCDNAEMDKGTFIVR